MRKRRNQNERRRFGREMVAGEGRKLGRVNGGGKQEEKGKKKKRTVCQQLVFIAEEAGRGPVLVRISLSNPIPN